jgi:anti-sigma regulatory factor (Ser/Thr protein kinase)
MTASHNLQMNADFLSVRALGVWIPVTVNAMFGQFVSEELAGTVELCVHELCINIVEHAYTDAADALGSEKTISVTATHAEGSLVIETLDAGAGFEFDPLAETDPRTPSIRGYGLMIVKQLTSSVTYQRNGDRNCWSLCFEIPNSQRTQFSNSPTCQATS